MKHSAQGTAVLACPALLPSAADHRILAGAFLIPYFIALVFEGVPLLHIELAIGQRLRRGSVGVWTATSPYLGGVGLGCLSVSFLVSSYYNMALSWVLWCLLNSFQHPLPWGACPLDLNRTGFVEECQATSTVSYFWYRQTLNVTAAIEHSGSVQWWLLSCLAACWAVAYLCVIRGIESTGKAIYFTVSFPYLVLTVFLIRGLTLPGAVEGLSYLFTPNNPGVWLDAATQIFFSLSLATGGHMAFARYNEPRNDCEKDTVTIGLVNSMTSLHASITVFSVLGFKAAKDHGCCLDRNTLSLINEFDFPDQGISRDESTAVLTHLNTTQPERVAGLYLEACHLQDFPDTARKGQASLQSASGPGLAFVIFTEAILHMPGSPVWAVLFSMLLTLGLSSMFGNKQGIITPLLDMRVLPRWVPEELLTAMACLACVLPATGFTLQSGSYWLETFDSYVASVNLIVLAFFEVVGVACVCGLDRFCDDIEWMTGRRPGLYRRATWKAIGPLLLLTIFVTYFALLVQTPPHYRAWNPQYEQLPLKQKRPYPGWLWAICALLSFPALWVLGIALVQLLARCQRKQDMRQDTCLELQDRGVC